MTFRAFSGVFVTVLVLAGASPALAATKRGITPLAPKANATVPAGRSPTFKLRVRGAGQVWVRVCRSNKKNADGVICSDESIGRARKKGSAFQYRPKFFDFDAFWLNSPGTYYWQAHRIHCPSGVEACLQEGPVLKLNVV